MVIPGAGDRIFSMTQDDELVVTFPARMLDDLVNGLKDAGRKIGARYPVAAKLLAVLESRNDWIGMFSVIEDDRVRMTALATRPDR